MKESQKARLEELQKEHGDGRTTHTVLKDGTLLVFRAPTIDEWDRHRESLKVKREGAAFRELAQITCVEPDVESLKKVFVKYPACSAAIVAGLKRIAGHDIDLAIGDDGTARHVLDDGTSLAFRTPTLDEWETFQDSLNTKKLAAAYRDVVREMRLEPDAATLERVFAKLAGIHVPIANAIFELAGGEVELTVKKE